MKFFLDTADLAEIEKAFKLGILDGVTTNPALLSKQSLSYKEGIKKIVELTEGAIVFAEVLANSADEMVKEGREINTWGPNMIVKLPMIPAGIQACSQLSHEGVKCAITMVYSVAQALVAAKAGAVYIAPFIARANEVGVDGLNTVSEIADVYQAQGIETGILTASLRTGRDAAESLRLGATAVTLPFAVLNGMMKSPLTEMTLNNFMGQWAAKNAGGIF